METFSKTYIKLSHIDLHIFRLLHTLYPTITGRRKHLLHPLTLCQLPCDRMFTAATTHNQHTSHLRSSTSTTNCIYYSSSSSCNKSNQADLSLRQTITGGFVIYTEKHMAASQSAVRLVPAAANGRFVMRDPCEVSNGSGRLNVARDKLIANKQ